MLSCSQCQRFLREDALSCPFCGGARATTFAPIAIAIGVMLVGCGPSVSSDGGETAADDDGDMSVSVSNSASADDGPMTTPSPSTTMPGTTTATATDPTIGTMTTAESTSTTEGDDDVVDDEGCAFYGCPPDGGTSFECDTWAQDCPIGEKCMPWANDGGPRWNATRCAPVVPSPHAVGDPCLVEGSALSGIDECELGTMCWDVDPSTNQGTCVANCGGSPADPVCAGDTECFMGYAGVVSVCIVDCDPLLQDCVDSATCVPDGNDDFFCVPDASAALGQTGDACDWFDECDPGLFCTDAEAVPDCVTLGCCTEFCDLASPDPNAQCSQAADGVTCEPWFLVGTAEHEFLGKCVLPS